MSSRVKSKRAASPAVAVRSTARYALSAGMRSNTSGWFSATSVLPLSVDVLGHPCDGAGRPSRPAPSRKTVPLGLLGLPEDLGDLVDLRKQVVGDLSVQRALGTAGAGQLGRLVHELVQLGVLLEV